MSFITFAANSELGIQYYLSAKMQYYAVCTIRSFSRTAILSSMTDADNLRIKRSRPLIAPAVLIEEIPLPQAHANAIVKHREEIANIVHNRDPRLLVVVGPCSVHDPVAVLEYAARLAALSKSLVERIKIVMRVYFEKPRTTVGWKGFINDPNFDESYNVNKGLREARKLLREISYLGLATGTEFLDTTFGQYYADCISWGAIGARTVESQIHRQLASGLSMPVGIKNSTNGNIEVAMDAITAAASAHVFPSLTKEGAPALLETTGNTDCHLILRGGIEPNYQTATAVLKVQLQRGLETGLMVDCSHGNSQKIQSAQIKVAKAVMKLRQQAPRIMGLMIESHLVAGQQDSPVVYGQSITDACIGWQETEIFLSELEMLM